MALVATDIEVHNVVIIIEPSKSWNHGILKFNSLENWWTDLTDDNRREIEKVIIIIVFIRCPFYFSLHAQVHKF